MSQEDLNIAFQQEDKEEQLDTEMQGEGNEQEEEKFENKIEAMLEAMLRQMEKAQEKNEKAQERSDRKMEKIISENKETQRKLMVEIQKIREAQVEENKRLEQRLTEKMQDINKETRAEYDFRMACVEGKVKEQEKWTKKFIDEERESVMKQLRNEIVEGNMTERRKTTENITEIKIDLINHKVEMEKENQDRREEIKEVYNEPCLKPTVVVLTFSPISLKPADFFGFVACAYETVLLDVENCCFVFPLSFVISFLEMLPLGERSPGIFNLHCSYATTKRRLNSDIKSGA
ncbi:hypothetical protein FQR65_LT06272 [Abscondita terminalis]|nr:hypothetical protein FQR65_LT06272 [Abscondita terminalis]